MDRSSQAVGGEVPKHLASHGPHPDIVSIQLRGRERIFSTKTDQKQSKKQIKPISLEPLHGNQNAGPCN